VWRWIELVDIRQFDAITGQESKFGWIFGFQRNCGGGPSSSGAFLCGM
jgi:hypothetical protein